jgi:hypothetical protein
MEGIIRVSPVPLYAVICPPDIIGTNWALQTEKEIKNNIEYNILILGCVLKYN